MSNVYYAWIPILTNTLNFDYSIRKLKRKKEEITKDAARIDGILSKTNGEYYTLDTHEDVEDKKFKVIVSITDKIVDNILIFNREDELKARAVCAINSKGLVTFKLEYPNEKDAWKEHEMIEQFYIIVRDIYHSHTHHKEHEDLLLKPVIAKDEKTAIGEILKQYDEKIIKYHKKIISDIQPYEKFDLATELIVAAKGEMTYASSFVNLFKTNIENHEGYHFVFSNALQSINILANEIESAYTHELNIILTALTMAIVFLTFPIAIDAIFGSSEYLLKVFNIELSITFLELVVLFYTLIFILILIVVTHKLWDRASKKLKNLIVVTHKLWDRESKKLKNLNPSHKIS